MLNTQRLLLLAWDNLGVGIIVFITTRDNHYYDEENIKINASGGHRVSNTRQVDKPKKEPVQLSVFNQPPVKRAKAKREESKLQLSLFD